MNDQYPQSTLFSQEFYERSLAEVSSSHGEARKVPRLFVVDRQQLLFHPVEVEKLIGPEHEARAIWEFVGRLDLRRYYEEIRSYEGEAGGPAHDPRLLVAIWAYSYAKGISSAREIERLCSYDPAYQWLTGMGCVNNHTLSDFRVKHKEALDQLFVEVLGLLSSEGLITLERVVHDGSKVKACASGDTFRREGKVRACLEMARKQVEAMDDPREAEEVSPRIARAQRRAAVERVERLENALEELGKIRETKKTDEEKAKARVSITDPEARIMKHGAGGGYAPSYNMQLSTDCANGVVVGASATQAAADYNELAGAAERVEEMAGQKPEQLVADGGFTSRESIIEMEERGINFYGSMEDGEGQSAGQLKRQGVSEEFKPGHFIYHEEKNEYQCPEGKTLRYESKELRSGLVNYRYRAKASDCRQCPWKERCCPKACKKGRVITRAVEDPRVIAFREKMESAEGKVVYRQRGPVAEFTNAWLKDKIGLRQLRVRGLLKAGMEVLWACIAYNFSQWVRLHWRPRFAVG